MKKSLALVALSALVALCSGCIGSIDDPDTASPDEDDDSASPDGDMESEDVGSAQSAINIGNATVTSLCVSASDASEAGTTNAVEVDFETSTNDFWSCTITGGVARAATACCTPTRTWKQNTNTQYNREAFYVQFKNSSSTDGLRVGNVKAVSTDGNVDWGTFTAYDGVDGEGCAFGSLGGNTSCGSFWIDADGHDNCWQVKIWNENGAGDDPVAHCVSP